MRKIITTLPSVLLIAFALFASVGANAANHKAKPYETVGEAAEATTFAKSIEDLPLMPGLALVEEKDLLIIFGKQRIAQTTAKGRGVDVDAVYYFYQETLPQLGWKQHNMKLYFRNGEQLRLQARSSDEDGITYVSFEVLPE